MESLSKFFFIVHAFYVKFVQLVLKKYLVAENGLNNSVLPEGFAGVHRNANFLAYKKYSSKNVIQIGKSQLWIKTGNGLVIGDITGLDEYNFEEVMHTLKSLAFKLGIKCIQFHSSPGTTYHTLFCRYYQAEPSFPVLFQDFGSCIPLKKIKFTFADIDIF